MGLIHEVDSRSGMTAEQVEEANYNAAVSYKNGVRVGLVVGALLASVVLMLWR